MLCRGGRLCRPTRIRSNWQRSECERGNRCYLQHHLHFPLDDTYTAVPFGLTRAADGSFYGATQGGGGGQMCEIFGCGTSFRLYRQSDGTWAEEVLYNFGTSSTDGSVPEGGVVLDAQGNVYGTTLEGGTLNNGTAYELSKQSDGTWIETILYNFGAISDGSGPRGGLVFDSSGNLYGGNGLGVFRLTRQSGGTWTETMIHTFGGSPDGEAPNGDLFMDSRGNLFGTSLFVGSDDKYCGLANYPYIKGCGTVFELSPQIDGTWSETILYSFSSHADGSEPNAPILFDASGNLYGTTPYGGSGKCKRTQGCGTLFELSPQAGGGWSKKTLWNFQAQSGASPVGALLRDVHNDLYGATAYGGRAQSCSIGSSIGCGTVFSIHETGAGVWAETVLHDFDLSGTDGAIPTSGITVGSDGNFYGTTGSTAYEIQR